jgi:hypothetical protein
MTNHRGWCISKIGWCVGSNTACLAKLPHFPSFLSLFSKRANRFDGDSDRIKLVSKPTKAEKSGVLVKQFQSATKFSICQRPVFTFSFLFCFSLHYPGGYFFGEC